MGREMMEKQKSKKINKYIVRSSALMSVLFVAGCFHDSVEVLNAETQNINNVQAVGYTYHTEDGNRFVRGKGSLNSISPIDIPLPSAAVWIAGVSEASVVGSEVNNASYWVAVLSDGRVKAFKVDGQSYEAVDITPSQINLPIPPTLVLQDDGELKLGNVFTDASVNTSAVILNDVGDRAYIANNGDLVLLASGIEKRLSINALPYARLLMDENQRLLVLTDPTSIYDHRAVLGNAYDHASSITLVNTVSDFNVENKITLTSPDVIEGNALIWRDVDGGADGSATREIITTVARKNEGGRLVVFNEDGTERSSTSSIGIDHRWRHQVAVAPFKSNEMGIVSVYIPHLAPKIEYFRLDDDSLTEDNLSMSYSSHLTTGLNIDMGIAGDFDNDGKTELLLVERIQRNSIGAFEYTDAGIELDWTLPLANSITSNVAAVTLNDDSIAYAVGQGRSLRIWHP